MKRKICVVITARPSYSRIKTALSAIKKHSALELQLVVTTSALLDRYGSVVNFIEQDGFSVTARIQNVIEGGNLTAAAKTTGLGMLELATVFENIKPDIVITIADRFETLATAACASIMHIPLVHIQGGEITGNIDDKIRHAVTKLADIHLVATEDAKNRVLNLGEHHNSIFNTGCPSIDIAAQILLDPDPRFNPFEKYGGSGSPFDSPYLVVLQHPVTSETHLARIQIDIIQRAISKLRIPTFWFWPNPDTGTEDIARGIRSFQENEKTPIYFLKNIDTPDFLKLLKNSRCLIGNSSVGIRECSFLGVPVVNIGTRQLGRQRGENVIDVDCDETAIIHAIKTQLRHGHYPSEFIYGNGGAGKKIADILAKVPLHFTKRMTY